LAILFCFFVLFVSFVAELPPDPELSHKGHKELGAAEPQPKKEQPRITRMKKTADYADTRG
jgi:hypothetical protein